MRLTLAATFVLSMAVFIACQTTEAPASTDPSSGTAPHESASVLSETPAENAFAVDEHGHKDEAPRIELAKAKELFDKGEAFFIDTRSADNYGLEHIKGAVNIPVSAIEARVEEVPKGKTIIAYCSWKDEHTSARAVQTLIEKGYTKVFALKGGTAAWKQAGYPMDSKTAEK